MSPQSSGASDAGTAARAPGTKARRKRRERLAPGNLFIYIVYALLLHLLFFGLSAFSDNLDSVVQVREIPVELMGMNDPDNPFGASPPEGDPEQEPESSAPPRQDVVRAEPKQAKAVPDSVRERVEPAPVNVAEALDALETNSKETIYRNNVREAEKEQPDSAEPRDLQPPKRTKVGVAAAAARAAGRRGGTSGVGRGRRGGRGGLGEGYGIKDKDLPIIAGGAVFGSGKRGALRGVLCFIPVGTKRLSDVHRCKPEGVMYANRLDISPRRFNAGFPGVSERLEWFAIDYKGRFTVSKSGTYKFRAHSDDGSLVWVDGQLIVQNDGGHAPRSKVGSIDLEEGKHRIRVFYFQGPRYGIALQLFVEPPGEAERLWGPKL